jgi:putative heme-binding domain-containing protein
VVLSGFLDAVERQRQSLATYRNYAEGSLRAAIESLSPLFSRAQDLVNDPAAPVPDRLAAISVAGRGLAPGPSDTEALVELLRPQVPSTLQKAALTALRRFETPALGPMLLKGWRSYEPSLRTEVLNVLLSRPEWTQSLLAAIDEGAVKASQISPADQQKMLASSHEPIRTRAGRLFTIAVNRRQLLQDYAAVLDLSGNRSSGAELFRQNCASCHRFRGEGVDVGPDLGALGNKSPQALLVAILAPNQAVETRYLNYTALTKSDHELSGILLAETPGSVTIRSAGGTEELVLRSDLQELFSSGLSLMPDGFEQVMNRQQLADLLAFLVGHD